MGKKTVEGGDAQQILQEVLENVFELADLQLSFNIEAEEELLKVELSGDDEEALKERDGQLLDALQFFTKRVLQHKLPETKVEVVAEIETPVVDETPEVSMVEEITTPIIVEATPADTTEVEEETQPDPFMIVKEAEEVSFTFDMSSNTTVTDKHEETPEMKNDEAPIVVKAKDEIRAEAPSVNMDIKRNILSTNSLQTPSADVGADSKVTKIAEVTLSSQPPISDSEARAKAQEKIQKLRELSFKVKTPGGLAELENEPAYKRKNYTLNDTPHSSESEISRLSLGTEEKKPSLRPDNSFLHDKPD